MQLSLMPMYPPRVKVYRLNDDGKWDDKGTGHVSVEYLERSDAVGLVVIDEEDNATLLVHRISADDIYQRQEDTIISWQDPEVATDLALSFQESMGCAFIWDQVCSVQRQIQFPSVGSLETGSRHLGEELEHSGTSQDEEDQLHDAGNHEAVELPLPELNSLPAIAKLVSEVSPFHRDRVAALLLRDTTYLRKLLDLFRLSEDLENLEGLHLMYRVVKGLILLNDSAVFEYIFQDDLIMDVVGALEYDPELPEKQNYRQYLREHVVFKEAVPIRDPAVLSKIHQTYRIGYIKDVILPRALDDQTFGTLNSLMLFNHVEVVSALQNDTAFLQDLFAALRQRQDTDRSWRDMVAFLQEFCGLAKHLQPAQRNQLFSALISLGLFEIATRTLQSPDESVRLVGTEVLMATLSHDAGSLRSFLVEPRGSALFSHLIKGMLTPGEGGLQAQLLEMMRMLLDSETMEASEKSSFLDLFYEDYMEQLVATLVAGCRGPAKGSSAGEEGGAAGGAVRQVVGRPLAAGASRLAQGKLPIDEKDITPETLGSICELLCFCVQHHSFRIKYFVLRNNVVEKVLRLTRRKERYLVVAAVRFLRTCVGLKDEFYYRYLVKNNLFEPVIVAFRSNGERYNLLNSAVIELVDFIRKEGIKSLIVHLWETYGSYLGSIGYVETFQLLRVKYEQILDGAGGSSAAAVAAPSPRPAASAAAASPGAGLARDPKLSEGLASLEAAAAAKHAELRRKRDGSMDQDEEAYFNSEEDDEDSNAGILTDSLAERGGNGQGAAEAYPSAASPVREWPVLLPGTNGTGLAADRRLGLVDYEDEDDDSPTGGGLLIENTAARSEAVPLQRGRLTTSLSQSKLERRGGELWDAGRGGSPKRGPTVGVVGYRHAGEVRSLAGDGDHGSRAAAHKAMEEQVHLLQQEAKRRRMEGAAAEAVEGEASIGRDHGKRVKGAGNLAEFQPVEPKGTLLLDGEQAKVEKQIGPLKEERDLRAVEDAQCSIAVGGAEEVSAVSASGGGQNGQPLGLGECSDGSRCLIEDAGLSRVQETTKGLELSRAGGGGHEEGDDILAPPFEPHIVR